jgi:lipopolysaccharide/colanic/teichoic acid biosynthesis glycosyltransferase
MTLTKRIFDIVFALALGILLLPFQIVVAVLILILDGRPIFYVSERMKSVNGPFSLFKFRTMRTDTQANTGVTGGEKTSRITRTGKLLRKTRLDELPQLWNILIGDMSFVGPRPPLRQYVDRFPEIYSEVLSSRPGVTGLASLKFHKHE